MSTQSFVSAATTSTGTLSTLARLEVRRYARHPLFLFGLVVLFLVGLLPQEPATSTALNGIVPAAVIGVFGIVIAAALTRRSDTLRSAAGAVPAPERTRTLALLLACLLPFAVGVAWWVWAVVYLQANPPTANGFPFGPADDVWIAAVMFGQGPMACLGGPVLGVAVARWLPGRAAPALAAVGVVAVCVVLQGLIEPLRRVRVVAPWTHWGGSLGINGDPERMLIFPGSPYWWLAYLLCLCGLGAIAALLHDPDAPRRPLLQAATAVGALAVVATVLAIVTGIPDQVVNPLHS